MVEFYNTILDTETCCTRVEDTRTYCTRFVKRVFGSVFGSVFVSKNVGVPHGPGRLPDSSPDIRCNVTNSVRGQRAADWDRHIGEGASSASAGVPQRRSSTARERRSAASRPRVDAAAAAPRNICSARQDECLLCHAHQGRDGPRSLRLRAGVSPPTCSAGIGGSISQFERW